MRRHVPAGPSAGNAKQEKTVKKTVFGVALLVVALTVGTQAGTTMGKFCWADNFGNVVVLQVSQNGTEVFDVSGYLKYSGTCNGTHTLPLSGSVVLTAAGSYSVGYMSMGAQPGTCHPVTWSALLNPVTLSGTGGWDNVVTTGSFTLAPMTCPAVPTIPSETPAGIENPIKVK
jgi:hypothetical protein